MLPFENKNSAFHTNVFIQLMITHKIKSSFISEMEEGAKGKIAERQSQRVRERERALVCSGCKTDHQKIHMFDKQDVQHLERLLLICKMRNLANDISHNRSILTAKIFGVMTIRHFLTRILKIFKNHKFDIIAVSFIFSSNCFCLPFQCCPLQALIKTRQRKLFHQNDIL